MSNAKPNPAKGSKDSAPAPKPIRFTDWASL